MLEFASETGCRDANFHVGEILERKDGRVETALVQIFENSLS